VVHEHKLLLPVGSRMRGTTAFHDMQSGHEFVAALSNPDVLGSGLQ